MTALLHLGRVRVTPAALLACSRDHLVACLARHRHGDWGCLRDHDAAENLRALVHGRRVMSAYPLDPAHPSKGYGPNTLWIITEPHPLATTILLPDDLLHPVVRSDSAELQAGSIDLLLTDS
jgi:hypothetical protein